jgi:hypothetical protein
MIILSYMAAFLDVAVSGDANLELPSALSNRSAVEVHVDLRPSTSANCNLIIDLPLHARYPVRFYKLSVVTNMLLHMLLYGKFAFSILEISLH